MSRFLVFALAALLAGCGRPPAESAATVPDAGKDAFVLVTWNLCELGRTKSDAEIERMAEILRRADLVALQEVVAKDPAGAQAVARLDAELDRSGTAWDYAISDPTRSSSGQVSERYAFLWKPSRLRRLGRFALDDSLAAVCDREPFLGWFRFGDGASFRVVNFHSRPHDERPDLEAAHFRRYPQRFREPVVVAGDFNLDEDHPVWDPLYDAGYTPAVRDAKTTLKRKCSLHGGYRNNAIDNIYVPAAAFRIAEADVHDFVGDCDSLYSARRISDHLPVWAVLEPVSAGAGE